MISKALVSLLMIGVVAAVAGAGTLAYFSDTETSTGNTFTTGAIDLKVDVKGTDNANLARPFSETDLTSEKFFNYNDVKPGDNGEATISLHVNNNPAWACMYIENLANDDPAATQTEPEKIIDADSGVGNGELQDHLYVTVWKDLDGDNVKDDGEPVLVNNELIGNKVIPIAVPGGEPLAGEQTYYLGVSWNVPGATTGNDVQTDSVTGDVRFYAEQSRNNQNFVCPGGTPQ